ncbi:alpha/beta fold hydrolase [Micromonospora sp. NPDC050397]|uniref:alpha/beta fold hydrolase n=1 Tax=Micromonospora sp. NPDC050397 TaxID=3364279 RepID=UPI00384C0F05
MPVHDSNGVTWVLVPGAGGSAWYWHLVEPELRRRGHRVIAVDLPADDPAAGFTEYADTVVDAARAYGVDGAVVVVGQSMGAFTAPIVCQRLSASLLVLVNGMIPKPGETAGQWWDNTGQEQARRDNDLREGRLAAARFDVLTYLMHDVPPEVVRSGQGQHREQSETPFGQVWPLTAWPDVPTRALTGRDDRFFPADFQRRVAEERLGITPDLLPGGHLLALAHPVELADRLDAYRIDVLTAPGRAPSVG